MVKCVASMKKTCEAIAGSDANFISWVIDRITIIKDLKSARKCRKPYLQLPKNSAMRNILGKEQLASDSVSRRGKDAGCATCTEVACRLINSSERCVREVPRIICQSGVDAMMWA
jgi:hypothetical protein